MKNKVNLLGRIGADPETKHFEGGTTKTTFSLATSEKYKDKQGNKQEITDWHNIVVWGKLAEIAQQYLKKGHLIDLTGKIRQRSWEDGEGNKKYITEILCDNFIMLPSGEKREPNNINTESAEFANGNDDLPF